MADVIQPESTIVLRVKEKHWQKMTYTLAIVDEGLLGQHFKLTTEYLLYSTWVKPGICIVLLWSFIYSKLDKLSVGGDGSELGGKSKANRLTNGKIYGDHLELEGAKNHRVDISKLCGFC